MFDHRGFAMFGIARRRSTAVAAVLCAGLGAGVVVAVQAAQASASGGTAQAKPAPGPNAPTRPSGARVQVSPAAVATNVHCGQTVTASVTLNGDLFCFGNALIVTAPSININLGGHRIGASAYLSGIGVTLGGKTDTVQNGVISGFGTGVYVTGTTDTVLNVRANDNFNGISDYGTGTKLTTNALAFNSNVGVLSSSTGATYSGNRALNSPLGFEVFGTKTVLTGNTANGNTNYGIYDAGYGTTLTKNIANFNGGNGIRVAEEVAIDGLGNTAKGNGYGSGFTPIQCFGVVCA
jgi:parallel beta-helix repeat protein